MIKIKILDTGHSILTLNIFGSDHTAGRIPENMHVHDFQAFSFVTRGKIKEQQFDFSKGTDLEISIYINFVKVMSQISPDVQAKILLELEEIFTKGTDINISQDRKYFKKNLSYYKGVNRIIHGF